MQTEKLWFVSGPYDNVNKIMRTLNQTVGGSSFDFITPIDENEFDSLDW